MEFEKAIFRVYERSLEGVEDDDENPGYRSCRIFEYIAGGLFFTFGTILITLHLTYVGKSGCLPELLSQQHALQISSSATASSVAASAVSGAMNMATTRTNELSTSNGNSFKIRVDQIIGVKVAKQFKPTLLLQDDDDAVVGADADVDFIDSGLESSASMSERVAPSTLSDDEVRAPKMFLRTGNGWSSSSGSSSSGSTLRAEVTLTQHANGTDAGVASPTMAPTAASGGSDSNTDDDTLDPTVQQSWFGRSDYDYIFTHDPALLYLPKSVRDSHGFEVVNITIPAACYGNTFIQSLLPFGGADIALENFFMYSTMRGGVLVSAANSAYSWGTKELKPWTSFGEYIYFKLGVLTASLISFFVLFSISALLVRILISSGVVLIFPLFWLFGVPVFDNRVVSLSYPWLGIPIEMIRANNQSPIPFVAAHSAKVLLYYIFYESVQFAFSAWLYGRGSSTQDQLWLFALVMLWEYYSMIYVRSVLSIHVFPRASLAIFLLYHFYLFCFPAGFHALALLTLFLLLVWLMAACVRRFEVKALHSGRVSLDTPRALYSSLPYRSWNVALAPDETIFMPVMRRAQGVYESVPPPSTGAAEGAGTRQGGALEVDSANGVAHAGTTAGTGVSEYFSSAVSRVSSAINALLDGEDTEPQPQPQREHVVVGAGAGSGSSNRSSGLGNNSGSSRSSGSDGVAGAGSGESAGGSEPRAGVGNVRLGRRPEGVGTSVPSTGVVNPLFSRSQRQVTSGEYMGIADEEETHQGDL